MGFAGFDRPCSRPAVNPLRSIMFAWELSAKEMSASARSIRIASSACSNTRAAPPPFQQTIKWFPSFSSSCRATLSMAGISRQMTGRSALVDVITIGPSTKRFQRFRELLNMRQLTTSSQVRVIRVELG
ncbi:MAG: hypothetical protein JWP25_7121 [Bradyrhizobium sp.]|nr:hypothetical protein [Bradyrhizobium sp.]